MADNTVPLLKRVYVEGCPGCKMDQKNEAYTGAPYKEFFYVWVMALCTSLPISSLFPFLYFMIRDLHIAKRTEDIGFYAGFLGASFMAGRALSSTLWGVVADRYGRKPVILAGAISVVIFNTLFGFSATYWMAITTRFLLGSLNGVLGPIKAYAMEICRAEHQALSLSIMSTAWGIGLIVGPAIGGLFSQPAEKYPGLFSHDSIFGRFPYCLPCILISLFAVGASIVCIWIPTIIITGTFILQNNAVPQHQRGAANGLSMTGMSCFKAVAPAAGGAIFSWAQKRQQASFLPGDQMVFLILNCVEAIGLLMTFKPFLMPPRVQHTT